MAFPVSPTNGQQYTVNGVTYVYDSSLGVWDPQGAVSSASPVSSVAGRTGVVTLSAADIATGTFPGAISMASTLTVSGASTLQAVSGTTGAFSGAVTMSSTLGVTGAVTAGSFSGAGTGLSGTASSLSIGGSAASATSAVYVYRSTVDTVPAVVINSDGTYYGHISRSGTQTWCLGYGAGVGNGTTAVLNWTTGGVNVTGSLTATTSVTAYYSDERLKKKIGKIENALDKIDELSGFLYVANDTAKQYGYSDEEVQVGLSAQAAKRVQPEVVKPAPFDTNADGTSKSGENYLTIQYERLVPLLVEGIKELRQELNSIKQQLK
jgi:hypothetical protein